MLPTRFANCLSGVSISSFMTRSVILVGRKVSTSLRLLKIT
jgi:hypothetical protein